MTPQSTFMIVAAVCDGQLENLRTLLRTMNKDHGVVDPNNTLLPFTQLDQLHVARFVIIEAKTADEIRAYGLSPYPWQPSLAFIGDCDGDSDKFFEQLVELADTGLKKIFSYCEGFSGQYDTLLLWLKQHNIKPQANYINYIGRTVKQVREEAALHESLSLYLQKITDVGREDYRALRQKLLTFVELEVHAGRLSLTPPAPTPMGWEIRNWLHKLGIPVFLLMLSPLLLILSPLLLWRLRMLERTDPDIEIRPERTHIQQLSIQEDKYITNQFNVFGDIKPGQFRLLLLKFSLLLLDYSVRHIYNRGFLTRVRTIHFARWVLMDNNRRVFFASNYDGSLESYMDDFINKVAWGLNLVFSNGVGYPSTRWLLKEGAEHEEQFKYTLRRHQLPSEVWYKAYPDISVYDLTRNSLIREGVENRQSSDEAIRQWLSLI